MAGKLIFGVDFLTQQAKTKLDGLNRSLDKTETKTKRGGAGFASMAAKAALVTAAVTAAVAGVKRLNAQLISLAKTGDHISDAARAFRVLGINIESLRRATGREIADIQLMEAAINLLSRGLQASQEEVAEYIRLMKLMSDAGGESFDTLIMRGSRSRIMFEQLLNAAKKFDVAGDIDSAGDAAARLETAMTNLRDRFAQVIDQDADMRAFWDGLAQGIDNINEQRLQKILDLSHGLAEAWWAISKWSPPGLAVQYLTGGAGAGGAPLPPDIMPLSGQRIPGISSRESAFYGLQRQRPGAAGAMLGGPTGTASYRSTLEGRWSQMGQENYLQRFQDEQEARLQDLLDKNEALKTAEEQRLEAVKDKWRGAIGTLEQAIVNAAMTGEFAFNNLANALMAMAATQATQRLGDYALAALFSSGGGKDIGKKFAGFFQEGGTVPGPVGTPQLIVAHGGETVLPAGRSEPSVQQTVNFNVSTPDARGMAEFFDTYGGHIAKQVLKAAQQSQMFRRRLQ
jgi:hypothetical protein